MKSRIQIAGVAHGSLENVLWRGDLPVLSGIPGMRIVLHNHETDNVNAFGFRQMCLEIDVVTGESEQVIYVARVSRAVEPDKLEG